MGKKNKFVSTEEMYVVLAGIQTVLREMSERIESSQIQGLDHKSFLEEASHLRETFRMVKVASKMGQKALDRHIAQFQIPMMEMEDIPAYKMGKKIEAKSCPCCGYPECGHQHETGDVAKEAVPHPKQEEKEDDGTCFECGATLCGCGPDEECSFCHNCDGISDEDEEE